MIPNPHPPTSRYHGLGMRVHLDRDGREHVYVARRFVPDPQGFATLGLHVVRIGERLDVIAAHYLDDPEQAWRLCDANRAMHPRDLEEPGRRLRITLPEGIPGVPDA